MYSRGNILARKSCYFDLVFCKLALENLEFPGNFIVIAVIRKTAYNASEVGQVQKYFSNSRALWSSPRLGIGPKTHFFLHVPEKNYISDLEKKIANERGRSAL